MFYDYLHLKMMGKISSLTRDKQACGVFSFNAIAILPHIPQGNIKAIITQSNGETEQAESKLIYI